MKIAEYKKSLKDKLRQVTLGFLIRRYEVLLAEKKVRFGKGRITGLGGKLNPCESLEEALRREIKEEIGVNIYRPLKVALVNFYFPYHDYFIEEGTGLTYSWDQAVNVYIIKKWKGKPCESEEIAPRWFHKDEIPYDSMWPDARFWLPKVLEGKMLTASFLFDKESLVEDYEISGGRF